MYVAAPAILGAGKQIFDTARDQWTDKNITLPRTQSLIGLTDAEAHGRRLQNERTQMENEHASRWINWTEAKSKIGQYSPELADYTDTMLQKYGYGQKTQDGTHYVRGFEMAQFYDRPEVMNDPMMKGGLVGFQEQRVKFDLVAAQEELQKLEAKFSKDTAAGKLTPESFEERKALQQKIRNLQLMEQHVAAAKIGLTLEGQKGDITKVGTNTAVETPSIWRQLTYGEGNKLIGGGGLAGGFADREDLDKAVKTLTALQKPHFMSQVLSRIQADPSTVGMTDLMLRDFMGTLSTIKDFESQEAQVYALALSSPKFVEKYGPVMMAAARNAYQYGLRGGEDPMNTVQRAWRDALDEIQGRGSQLAPGGGAAPSAGASVPTPALFGLKTVPQGTAPAPQAAPQPGEGEDVWNPEGAEVATQPQALAGSETPKQKAEQPPPKPSTVQAPSAAPPPIGAPEKKPAEGAAPAPAKPKASFDQALGVWVSADGSMFWDEGTRDRKTGKNGAWVALTPQMVKHLKWKAETNKQFKEVGGAAKGALDKVWSVGNPGYKGSPK